MANTLEKQPQTEKQPQPEPAGTEQKTGDNQTQTPTDNKPEKPPLSPERKRRRWIFAGLALLVLAIAAVPVYLHYASRESTDDAQIDGHITAISTRVGGTVAQVVVNDNQQVKAGDLLVKIDPRDYEVAVRRAEADLADARANVGGARANVPLTNTTATGGVSEAVAQLEAARAGVSTAQAQIAAAQARWEAAVAQVREAEANANKAAADLARYQQLVAKDEISRQQFDAVVATAASEKAALDTTRAQAAEAQRNIETARANASQANARVAAAQANVRSSQTVPQQVAIQQARVNSAEARVQQMQAALERTQLDLSYAEIKAPAAGIVTRKSVEVGQVVQPSQQLLALVAMNEVWVTANFKETQLKKMRVGQPVEVSVDALGGRKFRGHLDSVAGATGAITSLLPPENATGNYVKVVQRVPVKIVFESGQDLQTLRPGMSVTSVVRLDD